ncbi:MAG: hypothetical protein LUE61_02120 [Clostridiales bacterium]|nr:hypothetical protein [Clostridiales bacterium]
MRQNDNLFERPGTPSPGQRAGRAVRRHALLFRGVILLLLAAYLGGVGYVLYADTRVSSRFWGVFLLAVGTALALRLLLAVWDELTRRRVTRKDLQTRRDYNAYLARWRKDAASRNAALLAMAKQDLCLGQPEQALRDLDALTPEELNKAQLKTLYFYQAAAARLTGDEGLCADALLRCKGIPLAEYLTEMELDTLFRADTPEAAQQVELADAVSVWGGEAPRQRSVLLPLWGAFQVGYTAWYYGVAALLPYRYEYRTGFAILSLVLIFWGWAALALVLLYRADAWLWPRLRSMAQRLFVVVTTALAVLLVLVCLVGYGLLMAAFQDPEEDIGDGLLIVTDENYLRPEHNTYTYYQAHGPFLRSYYGPVEDEEGGEAGEDGASSAAGSAAQPEASDSAAQPETESAADAEESVSAQTGEEEALLLIAQSLADSGELDGADLDALTLRYSAKGSLYAVLWSEPWAEDESVTTRGRLVYDRESANGKCYLFVYYQDYLAADGSEAKSTSILEFYAVNKVSGEVIPGDKHSWSDVASAEYREATGE